MTQINNKHFKKFSEAAQVLALQTRGTGAVTIMHNF